MERYGQGSPYLRINGILATPEWKAAWNILTRPDLESHIYIPGVGYVNGLQSGNFLEHTGNTAGAVDTEVGLVLDAAGSVGAELCPPLAPGNGWNTGTQTTLASGSVSVANSASNQPFLYKGVLTVGKTYEVTYTISSISAGTVQSFVGAGSAGPVRSTPGTYTERTVCAGSGNGGLSCSTGTTVTLTGVSYKEVTGTHATQATTANKPILKRVPKRLGPELVQNGTFYNGLTGWVQYSGTASVSGGVASVNATAGGGRVEQALSLEVGKTYAYSATLTNGTASGIRGEVIRGAPGGYAALGSSPTFSSGTNAAQFTFTATGSDSIIQAKTLSEVTGTFSVDNISVREVLEWTYAWQFDGSNDVLTGQAPFQLADDHCVVAAVAPSIASGNCTIFEVGDGSSTGRAASMRLNSGDINVLWTDGTTARSAYSGTASPGEAYVHSARKVGNNFSSRKNGGVGGVVSGPLNATTSTALSIGNRTVAAANEYWNGLIYPIIAIKGTVSNAELRVLEVAVASTAGVTIP